MIHHQTEIYEHALKAIGENPMGKKSPDSAEAGRLANMLNGDQEEEDRNDDGLLRRRYDAVHCIKENTPEKTAKNGMIIRNSTSLDLFNCSVWKQSRSRVLREVRFGSSFSSP